MSAITIFLVILASIALGMACLFVLVPLVVIFVRFLYWWDDWLDRRTNDHRNPD